MAFRQWKQTICRFRKWKWSGCYKYCNQYCYKNNPAGQAPQALIYAVKAIPVGSSGMDNLEACIPQAPLNFRLTAGGHAPVSFSNPLS